MILYMSQYYPNLSFIQLNNRVADKRINDYFNYTLNLCICTIIIFYTLRVSKEVTERKKENRGRCINIDFDINAICTI